VGADNLGTEQTLKHSAASAQTGSQSGFTASCANYGVQSANGCSARNTSQYQWLGLKARWPLRTRLLQQHCRVGIGLFRAHFSKCCILHERQLSGCEKRWRTRRELKRLNYRFQMGPHFRFGFLRIVVCNRINDPLMLVAVLLLELSDADMTVRAIPLRLPC